jgi:putative heme transporter
MRVRGVSEKTEREDAPAAQAADATAQGEGPRAEPPLAEERELAGSAGTKAPDRPGGAHSPEGWVGPPRVVVPRWVQLVLLPLSVLALYALAKAAGKVLVIFIVAALIALILNPIVAFVQRRRVPRGLAVLAVYVAFFLILTGLGVLVANPISNQVRTFTNNLPHIVEEANKTIAALQHKLDKDGVHLNLVKQGKTALQSLEGKVAKSAGKLASSFGALLTEAASAIFDLVLVFVLSVYMLIYGQRIGGLIRRYMPDGDGTPADDYPTLVQNAVARYVGGQLLFSVIMGTTTGLALYLAGVLGIFPDGRKYAVIFAILYGLAELIPYVGPIIGAVPAVLVALLTHPISALWVTIVFVGLQQLEGHIVAPQIFGHTLRINPLLVMFALLLGLQVHGVIGALSALPILAVLRETVVYLNRHLTFESWRRSDSPLL